MQEMQQVGVCKAATFSFGYVSLLRQLFRRVRAYCGLVIEEQYNMI